MMTSIINQQIRDIGQASRDRRRHVHGAKRSRFLLRLLRRPCGLPPCSLAPSLTHPLQVRITLPGATGKQIDLDITPQFLNLRTPVYRLGLHLPDPVDDKAGNAKWDKDTHTLTVTLRMVREFDFLRQ